MITLSFIDFLLATLVYFIAALTQASLGIGGALIAAPFLLLINPVFVPTPILLTNVMLTFAVARRHWSHIHFRDLGFMLAGRAAGTIPALFLLAAVYFDLIFAAIILLAVIMSARGWQLEITRGTLIGSGFLAGVMGTTSSIGGPPIALLYQQVPKPRFIATMSMQLVVGGTISILAIALTIGIGIEQVIATVILLPGMLAGYFCANKIQTRITSEKIRYAVLGLSSAAAIMILIRALF